jgi:ketosteroid isomerase-like protein
MSVNKKTVQKYMEGFNETDHGKILSCLADDIVWDMPGFFHLEGKEAIDREIENDNFEGSPVINLLKMVEENNVVVAEGTVKVKKKAGGFLEAVFCEIFQMQNGRVKHLTTYQINK